MSTLSEAAKLTQNALVAGIIENVITVNHMFELLPFDSFEGNALAYNREAVLGTVNVTGVGDSITSASAKGSATWTQVTSALTTIIGDAEVNGLIQATLSNVNDQKAVQVASKAKSVGRKYQDMMINGLGSGNQFTGLLSLLSSGQKVDTGVDGDNLSLAYLDELFDKVTDKDGEVDYVAMNARTIRSYLVLLRALGGARIDEVVTLPSGKEVLSYRRVPILRNDWIPITQDRGATSGSTTTVLAGTFDDGSRTHGVSGLTAARNSGIVVVEVGEKEDKDESITRVKWYCGMALFSDLGLAGIPGIKN